MTNLEKCDSSKLSQGVIQPDQPQTPKNFFLENSEFSTLKSESPDIPEEFSTGVTKGDRVVVLPAVAKWFRRGSQSLPKGCFDRAFKGHQHIPLSAIEGDIFHELCDGGIVLSVSRDGERVKVRHQKTGRTSVFSVDGVQVLEVSTNA
jgi:hypothetical protein